LVKAFLKAGILGEDRLLRETTTGTPQGGILSPLLSNVALSVLDEYIAQAPGGPRTSKVERARRRRHGRPNYRLVRYADDWCLMVSGTKADAEALREEIAEVLSTMGLRLSPEKTLVTHSAPRGASLYPRCSWEELGGTFLGLMAYPDPKGKGNNSMPGKQRSCSGV